MKKLFGLILVFFALICTPALCWDISSYYINIDVNKDSSLYVSETITADFGDEMHHGIYRDIPISGKDRYGNNYRLRCSDISVTDQSGRSIKSAISIGGGRIHIKIGDPDVTLSGMNVYVIRYKVMRAVHYFPNFDEIYWNAVGPEWTVPILKTLCTVNLPANMRPNQIRKAVYTGYYGSTESDAESDIPSAHTARFWGTRAFNPGDGMTVVVGWPKGVVQKPSFYQEAIWFVFDNGYFFIPPIFIVCLFFYWLKVGQDPITDKSSVVAFDPPDNLNPAELGTLIDETVDMRDISASIIDLAVRGFIHIKATTQKTLLSRKTDYTLELTKPYNQTVADQNLTAFEVDLIKGLFGGNNWCLTSMLQNSFFVHLPHLKDDLYDSMIKRGYFKNRPDSVRSSYVGAGVFVIIVGILLTLFAPGFLSISFGWGLSILLCGVILALASKAMPRKTKKGKDTLIAIKGFEEYISRAERAEIEYQERNDYFEKFLPYAMALGIAHKWASAFDGLQTQPPSWYSGDMGTTFCPTLFVQDLSIATNDWAGSMISQPRTNGDDGGFWGGGSGFSGGFSGGGCGGGGGGAW